MKLYSTYLRRFSLPVFVGLLLAGVMGCRQAEPAKPAAEPVQTAPESEKPAAKSEAVPPVSSPIPAKTLLADAFEPAFWSQLETNSAFVDATVEKLGLQAYRKIGPVPSVRVTVMPGQTLEQPSIILEYQTSFHGTINIGGGPFGGNCVQVLGGRDAFAHRTFFGGTEDTNARQQFLDMFERRMKLPSKERRNITPEFDALFEKYMPGMPVSEVKAQVMTVIRELVASHKAQGAQILDHPLPGQFGAKLADNLYVYIRNFDEGSVGSKVPIVDPYFWLIVSGGPRPVPAGYLPAFPGAEGFGALTTGGRGGRVIYVTNLNTEGPGSFAEAVNSKGPRTVLFKVSGQIVLPEDLWITEPDMTLIGYTAPGEGVEICGRMCLEAGNIIMRGVRWRLRPPLSADGSNTKGDLHRLIFDHCSFAYGSDEALRFIGPGHTFWDYTLQYCIVGPGMTGLGTHPYGPEIGGVGSIHHCILQNTLSRSPEVDCSRIDWRNNLMYNVRSGHSKRLTSQFNLVNNFIINTTNTPYRYDFTATDNNYIAGNLVETAGAVEPFNPAPPDALTVPWPVFPVTTQPASELEQLLLPMIGASFPVRDATDKFWIEGIRTRTGKPAYWAEKDPNWSSYNRGSNEKEDFIVWHTEDYPPPAAGAVAPADTDNDGMPDDWERANGFNPNDPSDSPADADKDGYTNLEEYLNRTNPRQYVDYTDPKNNAHTLH